MKASLLILVLAFASIAQAAVHENDYIMFNGSPRRVKSVSPTGDVTFSDDQTGRLSDVDRMPKLKTELPSQERYAKKFLLRDLEPAKKVRNRSNKPILDVALVTKIVKDKYDHVVAYELDGINPDVVDPYANEATLLNAPATMGALFNSKLFGDSSQIQLHSPSVAAEYGNIMYPDKNPKTMIEELSKMGREEDGSAKVAREYKRLSSGIEVDPARLADDVKVTTGR